MTYRIPAIPKGQDFEDFVSAYLLIDGQYLERSIHYYLSDEEGKNKKEFLEMDIVATAFSETAVDKSLVEVKSGGFGFPDIFKVYGWMNFLNLPKGIFVTQSEFKPLEKDFAHGELNIELISEKNLDGTGIQGFYGLNTDEKTKILVETTRYSFAVERDMLNMVQQRKKTSPTGGISELYSYLNDLVSTTFFTRNPLDRIHKLVDLFYNHRNITARLAYERQNKKCPTADEVEDIGIDSNVFHNLFYKNILDKDLLYSSLYAELLNRLLVMKCCLEYVIQDKKNSTVHQDKLFSFLDNLAFNTLANNIRDGIRTLKTQQYSYRYPHFWQVFIYTFGGFVLKDKENQQFEILSRLTGIPMEFIPEALSSFDVLFPIRDKQWVFNMNDYNNLDIMMLFPMPFRGIGSNLWRWLCTKDGNGKFDNIKPFLTKSHTYDNLLKWNNLSCEYLKKYEEKEEQTKPTT